MSLNIYWKLAISLQRVPVNPKFQVEWVAPTNHSSQKTRLSVFVWYKIWTHHSFVLSQIMRLTDRRTDRILIAKLSLHSMQHGTNARLHDSCLKMSDRRIRQIWTRLKCVRGNFRIIFTVRPVSTTWTQKPVIEWRILEHSMLSQPYVSEDALSVLCESSDANWWRVCISDSSTTLANVAIIDALPLEAAHPGSCCRLITRSAIHQISAQSSQKATQCCVIDHSTYFPVPFIEGWSDTVRLCSYTLCLKNIPDVF